MSEEINVVDYDASWPQAYAAIKAFVWPAIKDIAVAIEHVGSTSVPGLAAKPIIDVDVIIQNASDLPTVIERLRGLGYEHRGNLGIEGREAFRSPELSI